MKKKKINSQKLVNVLCYTLIPLILFSVFALIFQFSTSAYDVSCTHPSDNYTYEYIDEQGHSTRCGVCGYSISQDPHNFNDLGHCQLCGYVPCTHENLGVDASGVFCKYCLYYSYKRDIGSTLSYFALMNPPPSRWSNTDLQSSSVRPVFEDGEVFVRSAPDSKKASLGFSTENVTISRYLIIKYRLSADDFNRQSYLGLELRIGGVSKSVGTTSTALSDGKWKIAVIDFKNTLERYIGSEHSFKVLINHDSQLDVAYIGMADSYYSFLSLLNEGEFFTLRKDAFAFNATDFESSYIQINHEGYTISDGCLHEPSKMQSFGYDDKYEYIYCTCGYVSRTLHAYGEGDFLGVCVNCSYICNHRQFDSSDNCLYCGTHCSHSLTSTFFNDDYHFERCSLCGYDLPDSFCSHLFFNYSSACACGYTCTHSKGFTDGICNVCFTPHAHDNTIIMQFSAYEHALYCGTCDFIYSFLPHDLQGSLCPSCGFICTHDHGFTDAICNVCDHKCTHPYVDSTGSYCFTCGSCLSHDYVDGVCLNCNHQCLHSDLTHDGSCCYCGTCIIHIFESASCTRCGYNCPHDSTHYYKPLYLYYQPYHDVVCDNCRIVIHTRSCDYFENNSSGPCTKCLCKQFEFHPSDPFFSDDSGGGSGGSGGVSGGSGDSVNIHFTDLFTSIYDAQANVYFSLLGYDVLGVNIASLIITLCGLAILIWVIKMVLGK